MKSRILKQLREDGGYLSGEQLANEYGVSRTAVWKAVSKLKQEGYPIEAVPNKGYHLASLDTSDLFNEEELTHRLQTTWAGHPLYFHEETGSTNVDATKLSDDGAPEGTLVVAAKQTAGKGRRGRTWISPNEGNVYMSILLRPSMRPETAPMSTLVMALAVVQALTSGQNSMPAVGVSEDDAPKATKESASKGAESRQNSMRAVNSSEVLPESEVKYGIKWPNDIVVSTKGGPYKKICGILTEMRLEEMEIKDVVIGTGINVNMRTISEEVKNTATSLYLALGKEIDRCSLVADIWRYFEKDYESFLESQDLSGLKEEYEKYLVNREVMVRVLDPKKPFQGKALGINTRGELLVQESESGEVITVANGEVSVRGVEGYVD